MRPPFSPGGSRLRRIGIGLLAGLISGCALLATFNTPAWSLPLGALIGIGYAFLTRPTERAYLESAVTAAAFGAPLWAPCNILA